MKTYIIEESVLNSKKNMHKIVIGICSFSALVNLFVYLTNPRGNLTIVFGMISIICFQMISLSSLEGNYFKLEGCIFSHYIRGAASRMYDLREVKFEVLRRGDKGIFMFIDKNGKKVKYASYLTASTFAEMINDINNVYKENHL